MSEGKLTPEEERTRSEVPALSFVARRLRRRTKRLVPHAGPIGAEQRAGGGKSGALRAAIFGANDGLVSNVSLIMGVAGAGQPNKIILLAGVAGLLAGAFSMAAGEYISMRVQREVLERLIHLEAHEIGVTPEAERHELAQLYERRGLSPELAARVAEEMMRDPEVALETHAREELGLDPQEGLGSPWAAAGSSFLTFSVGAIVPLVPFLVTSGNPAVLASAVLAAVTLFGVGAAMSLLTGKRLLVSGVRMLLVGTTAALITYGVGSLLHAKAGV